VKTYNLGELVFNGFPAFPTTPPRMYNQILTVLGYQPPADFQGVLQSPTPLGDNLLSGHEERFKVTDRSAPFTGTYQIATQLDNLNHIGVGPVFYGGHRGPDLAETWGTSKLGNENMGPIVTRGVLLDVLGAKIAQGAGVIDFATNGRPHLASTYRITVEDLVEAMEMGNIRLIEPGDVVLIRTGWNQLVNPKDPAGPHAPDDPVHPGHPDHVKYLASEPGIFLREARWLACHRPAIVGGDTWGLEVVGNPVSGANAFPVHQELMTFSGIRIGEGIVTDELAADGVFEFVYIVTPQFALGATAGNTPPTALGQPQRPHR
jgi:kynurenine formamidase